jgi:L-methionine (R)-S-oxide reductase
MQADPLAQSIEPLLAGPAPQFDAALRAIAQAFGAVSATLHRADDDTRLLSIVSHLGLPEALLGVVSRIPYGKGIGGLCAERREPITLCNLQTDQSGAARPNAKQTGVAGAISVPVFGRDGKLIGTLGVGKPGEHDYTEAEHRTLASCASVLGDALARA